jgi:hypothetical protein
MRLLRVLGRLLRWIAILVALVVAIPVAGFAWGWMTTPALTAVSGAADAEQPSASVADALRSIPGYQRPEESTFLTYPEWAIVYAAREYADHVAEGSESGFPYWAYIGRFWKDYAMVVRATADYPFNGQNHLMLVVIGTSHTIEHALQSVWENTVGRLTEWAAGWKKTPQDRFQAITAAEYAAFLDQVPWYRFPYGEKRAGLWRTATEGGTAAVRSIERKAAFGLAYTIKQAYAGLIASGLEATSDPAFLDIHVWAQGPVADAIATEANTRMVRDFGHDGAVFVTQRYQVFTDMVPRLVEKGLRFVEIGGNDDILVTVLSNDEVGIPAGARQLFAYQLPAEPSVRRTGLIVRVAALHDVLQRLAADEAMLEHVYDY